MSSCVICKSKECLLREKCGNFGFYECAKCNIEFAYPGTAGGANFYEELYGAEGHGYGYDKWEYGQFSKDARDRNIRGKLLEVGCGPGYFLELAAREGFDVFGIDVNNKAIQEAQSCGLRNTRSAHVMDATSCFPGIKFEAITLWHTLEHLDDPRETIDTLKKMLAPRGVLAIAVPNAGRSILNFRIRSRREEWDYPPHHLVRWSKSGILKFVKSRGLVILHCEEEQIKYPRQIWGFLECFFQLMTSTGIIAAMQKNDGVIRLERDTAMRALPVLILSFAKKSFISILCVLFFLPTFILSRLFLLKGTTLYVLAQKI